MVARRRRRRQAQPDPGKQPLKERKRAAIQAARPGNGRDSEFKKLAILEEVEPGWRKHFAAILRVSRTSYYVRPTKQAAKYEPLFAALREAHAQHPHYGVRRLAIHLGWSENKVRRLRTRAGIVIVSPSKKHRKRSGNAEIAAPPNILHRYARFKDTLRPQDGMDYSAMVNAEAWAQDFTHVWFQRSWHYLAVVINLKTREVVGWRLGLRHTSELTHEALA